MEAGGGLHHLPPSTSYLAVPPGAAGQTLMVQHRIVSQTTVSEGRTDTWTEGGQTISSAAADQPAVEMKR